VVNDEDQAVHMPEPEIREDTDRAGPDDLTRADLVACVRAAVAAPSIHNSQPWRFRIGDGGIDVFADWARRLTVIDPLGRELLISIGAAVFNLRLAMRQLGWVPTLRLLPRSAESDLVARVTPGRRARPGRGLTALADAIPRRHTNRRPFARVVIPAAVLEQFGAAAKHEGATLRVADAVGRSAILGLVRTAEERLRSQGIYRAELNQWTLPAHGRRDGVPPRAFGPWDVLEALPLRDFGLTLPELHRRSEPFEPFPTIVVLSTEGDEGHQWLRAGQALQRVLLVATLHGVAATPMSQPLEIPELRDMLADTAVGQWAQIILRLGYAQPATSSARRSLDEVLLPGPERSTA
jgi:nitroreductase